VEPSLEFRRSPREARLALGLLVLLTAAGLALGWNRGRLPVRQPTSPASGENPTSPDLALYRDVVAAVRGGANYYDVARNKIPAYGFPIASPLNWRLPTYAWVFGALPGPRWVQAALGLLSLAALVVAYRGAAAITGPWQAAFTTLLMLGVVRWALDGDAYLAQEPWAATLVLLSLGAHALGGRWRIAAVLAGTAALLFRELALPYCGLAFVCAAWHRRWREAAGWAAGIALFLAFLAWHVTQVRAQLAGLQAGSGAGLAQWFYCGGLDFVLLTTRMNGLVFAAPAMVLWLYLLAALLGLGHRTDETSRLACLAGIAYLLAFAIVGRPENFYWGLIPAPLLAWGLSSAPAALSRLWEDASLARGRSCISPQR
jgi:hypothetical protein